MVDVAQNAPDTVILAQDEASLYLQASLMRVWVPVGQTPVIKAAANRDCTHFYGALNLQTGQEVVLRSDYRELADLMNADVSALFLSRVLLAYPDTPILMLWDRAPWHKGEAIRSVLAANPRLQILCFPPACPELNPQEKVWKAAREAVSHNHTQAVSHNHTQAKLQELAQTFEAHLETTRFPCSLLEKHGYSELCAMFK